MNARQKAGNGLAASNGRFWVSQSDQSLVSAEVVTEADCLATPHLDAAASERRSRSGAPHRYAP